MTDYTLAKSLKDAKFPFREDYSHEVVRDENDLTKEWLAAPTLTELIEACGPAFSELALLRKRDSDPWRACTDTEDDDQAFFSGYGSTPEEAVARLWLALNPLKEPTQ